MSKFLLSATTFLIGMGIFGILGCVTPPIPPGPSTPPIPRKEPLHLALVSFIELNQIPSGIPTIPTENPWITPPKKIPPCEDLGLSTGTCSTGYLLNNIAIAINDLTYFLTIKDGKGNIIVEKAMTDFETTPNYRVSSIEADIAPIDNATFELTVTYPDGRSRTIRKSGIRIIKG